MFYVGLHKNLINALRCLIIILSIVSCKGDKVGELDDLPSLYQTPLMIALNTDEGYSINPLTGDSIQPIINSFGDTVKTGVPVQAEGKVLDPGSVEQPKVIPAGNPDVVPKPQNVFKIPENLPFVPVNKDSLKTFTPGVDTSSFVLVNSIGDTIPTGVPIPVKGNVVPCRQRQPIRALPARMRENIIINMKNLDEEQGMSSFGCTSILEDSRGNLWFGTRGGGVIMYNGIYFMYLTEKDGLSNNWIKCILEDSHGNLWFGTEGGGVSMFDGDSFIHFTEREGLSNHVQAILEDSHGNLWFGTWGRGVTKYNDETFTHFTQKEGLINNQVRSILEDSHGNLWFGTVIGASMYDGETFTLFSEKEGISF